jgi:uncharacterized protein (DUF1330 family)
VHYLIAPKAETGKLPIGCHVLADGEIMSFEEPWSFGDPLIVRVNDDAALEAAKTALAGSEAFAVEGLIEPGPSAAFVIAAHLMRDMERFKPYAAAIPGVVQSFNGKFIARAGKVTPIAGSFVPDRAVLIEFPTAADAVAFYFSDVYAPLLKLRLETTDPRFVVIARSGALPESARAEIEKRLSNGG